MRMAQPLFTKSILVSVGVILFKVAIIPKLANLPRLWVSFKFWLSPPYVFLVFNFIILAVAASSAFRRQKFTSIFHQKNTHLPHDHQNFSSTEIWNGISNVLDQQGKEQEQEQEQEQGKPVKWDFPTLFSQKFSHPSSEKFCAYNSSDEDAGDGDSMDATWKAIVESQGKQTPQLKKKKKKKSQTWDSSPTPRLIRTAVNDADADNDPDRFHQTLSFRRKISMTSEELKSRAEAFIEMVNRSIRLQRQESAQRFLQAMKRSV